MLDTQRILTDDLTAERYFAWFARMWDGGKQYPPTKYVVKWEEKANMSGREKNGFFKWHHNNNKHEATVQLSTYR